MHKPWLAHYEDGVPEHLDYPAVALHQMLDDSASKYADRPAVKMVLRYLPAGRTIGMQCLTPSSRTRSTDWRPRCTS